MSETLPSSTNTEQSPDTLDQEFIDYSALNPAESPYAKLAEADADLLESQDFYSDPPVAAELQSEQTNPLGFEPIGESGTFVVTRTSGEVEDGWVLSDPGNPIMDKSSNGVEGKFVTVTKPVEEGYLVKEVRLSDLKGWNIPPETTSTEQQPHDNAEAVESNDLTELTSDPEADEEIAEMEAKASEILSFSEQFRMMIRESASEATTDAQTKLTEAKQFIGRPKTKLLERRQASAQRKYDRISAKLDNSRLGFINRRRERKAAEAYQELQESTKALEGRMEMIASRQTTVSEKGSRRLEVIEQKKQELMQARIEAEMRKQIRLERRERRKTKVDSETHAEREARVKSFTKADMKRIRNLSIESLKQKN